MTMFTVGSSDGHHGHGHGHHGHGHGHHSVGSSDGHFKQKQLNHHISLLNNTTIGHFL